MEDQNQQLDFDIENAIIYTFEDLTIHEEEEVEEIIGYKFNDSSLLRQAFIHSSYVRYDNEHKSYERLEYMGDTVLNKLITDEQFFLYPDLDPGMLTKLRSANVDTEKLARVAIKLNLSKFLRHRNPLSPGLIEEFRDAIKEYPLHSYGRVDTPKVLADIVESIIGAIYIDCNRSDDITWQVVKKLLQPMITLETLDMNAVTKLNEICQKNGSKPEFVDLWKDNGEFVVKVNGECVGRGTYHRKRVIAYNIAAHNAYCQVVRMFNCVQEKIDDENPKILTQETQHTDLPCF